MLGRIQRPNRNEELFRRNERLMKLDIRDKPRCFSIPKVIYDAVEAKDIRSLKSALNYYGQIDEDNYFDPLKMLLRTEEAHQAVEMRKYDKLGYEILVFDPKTNPSYGVELRGQADNSLLDISDVVLLQVMGEDEGSLVHIREFKDDYVILKEEDLNDKFLGEKVNVYFVSSGVANQACEGALDDHQTDMLKRRVIFENADRGLYDARDEPKIAIRNSECDVVPVEEDTRLKQLNLEQRQTVMGILEAKCRPKPYILFGPPGTGKTHTLVEAVVQIYLRSPRTRVLFCANSNTCVDQTYKKLKSTGIFPDQDLVRLKPGVFMVAAPRVVVTTNIKSASLKTSVAFDYVFIDEAGHAHEAESLAPCCSLKHDGCLVLAGDPKQLGPVVQFEQAGKNGLESSMLERIIKWDIYQRQPESNKYNPKYLTKLIDCYRCDPRILAISNTLFYDNELRCLHSTPKSLMKIMGLRTPVQVLFCKGGEERQPQNSTSWENLAEINECVSIAIRLYKIGFTADQIGIMSPYRKQAKEMRKKLRETLRGGADRLLDERFQMKVKSVTMVPKDQRARDAACRNKKLIDLAIGMEMMSLSDNLEQVEMIEKIEWIKTKQDWNCKIDTVDSFQGNEREVVIFSPVRTSTKRHLGFLDDAKRFNVAMSRAKWLLIVVGSENVLKMSRYWNEFLINAKRDIKDWPQQSMLDSPYRQDRALFREYP